MIEFTPFPKIPRLSREIVVTEKIDGTNASILITDDFIPTPETIVVNGYAIYAASRTRWLTGKSDNFGFAGWVAENADGLVKLGVGHHFGEWWGYGIQRGYDLDHRRFSLFNVGRWNAENVPECCHVVPVLYTGPFDTAYIDTILRDLGGLGSQAAPGFMKPEGVVVYHTAGNILFKKTCEHDAEPKSLPKKPRPDRVPTIQWTGGRRNGATPGYAGPERRVPR